MMTFLVSYCMVSWVVWLLVFGIMDNGKTVLLVAFAPVMWPFVILWWML